jgi:hypothetical protein
MNGGCANIRRAAGGWALAPLIVDRDVRGTLSCDILFCLTGFTFTFTRFTFTFSRFTFCCDGPVCTHASTAGKFTIRSVLHGKATQRIC